MWFRKQIFVDTDEYIFIDEQNGIGYPLTCENEELYEKSIEKMKEIIREWMIQDAEYTTNLNQAINTSLVYQFKDIDLKYIAYPAQFSVLVNCMKDTEVNTSGSRFLDAIMKIYIHVPLNIIRVFQGRFLSAVIYGIPEIINGIPRPSKELWKQMMLEANWIPFILLVQDLFDNDDIVNKLNNVVSMNKQYTTQLVRRTNTQPS